MGPRTAKQHFRLDLFGDDDSLKTQLASVLPESRLLTECKTALSIFLHPELVHASERVGLLPFQSMPTIEIAHQMITAE